MTAKSPKYVADLLLLDLECKPPPADTKGPTGRFADRRRASSSPPHWRSAVATGPSPTSTSPAGPAALVRSGVSGSYLQLHGATGEPIKINKGALKWQGGVLLVLQDDLTLRPTLRRKCEKFTVVWRILVWKFLPREDGACVMPERCSAFGQADSSSVAEMYCQPLGEIVPFIKNINCQSARTAWANIGLKSNCDGFHATHFSLNASDPSPAEPEQGPGGQSVPLQKAERDITMPASTLGSRSIYLNVFGVWPATHDSPAAWILLSSGGTFGSQDRTLKCESGSFVP